MAKTHPGRAKAKSPRRPRGPQAKRRARERIAADRAAQKRAEARRRLLVPIASVAARRGDRRRAGRGQADLGSAGRRRIGGARSRRPADHHRSAAVLARVNGGRPAAMLQAVRTPGRPLAIGGKPAIVFVSEESCPFCAAERWPLAVALAHFGTWSHLGSTKSSATDVYPNTATLSFRTARYRSAELTLRTTDPGRRPIQPPDPHRPVRQPDRQPAPQRLQPRGQGHRRLSQGDHRRYRPGPARPGSPRLAKARSIS